MSAVHEAAEQNDLEALRDLLDADPGLLEAEYGEHLGCRPLYYACCWGHVEAARLLLDRGADLNGAYHSGGTPLTVACWGGDVEVVSLLLARGADPSLRSSGLCTVMTWASLAAGKPGSDHVAVLRLLIKDGRLSVDAQDEIGCTALYFACEGGHTERARVLSRSLI